MKNPNVRGNPIPQIVPQYVEVPPNIEAKPPFSNFSDVLSY
jgi:hypothetical protein